MIQWQYFPKSNKIPNHLLHVVGIFEDANDLISSDKNNLQSNEVLNLVAEGLENLEYSVERGKTNQIR